MTSGSSYYSIIEGFHEALRLRKPETNDIVVRAGVISPDRIMLHNYPIANPVTAFNPGLHYSRSLDLLELYPRIIIGYYRYVSYIARLTLSLDDVFSGYVNTNHYPSEIVVYPSTKYDVWGVEDPRVYELRGKLFMTYTGRTVDYFNPRAVRDRTLPVTAMYDEGRKAWVKKFVFLLDRSKFPEVVSNKDAFLHETGNSDLFVFHRPHFVENVFYLFVSLLREEELRNDGSGIKEVPINNAFKVLEPADFESKLGWASNPVDVGKDRAIVLVHAVDKDEVVYRVFALLLKLSKHDLAIEAITPHYIMEPRRHYELAGDRPLTIFPCGSVKIGKDTIILSYGASDSMVGLAMISLEELMGELDRGRIY